MANSVSVSVDFDDLFERLDKISDDAGKFTREAAQAGAQVLYGEAKTRAPVSDHAHYFYGTHQKYLFEAGTLRNSIYQAFSADNSIDGKKATYHISWNYKKCPYGFMVEYGTKNAPAHPFLRPSYDAASQLAVTVAHDRFAALMEDSLK